MEPIFASYYGKVSELLLPTDRFRLFIDHPAEFGRQSILPDYARRMIEAAEKQLEGEYRTLPISIYRQFSVDGNRSNYEGIYFQRRSIIAALMMGELCEGKGRFLEKLADGLWLTMEETTWVLPAHLYQGQKQVGLPVCYDGSNRYIDLFAGDTGGLLAWVLYLLREELDKISPIIDQRLLYSLHERIVRPFLDNEHFWWMGADGRALNNWTPWIISNILTVCALCVEDRQTRVEILEKSLVLLDRFIHFYSSDGGCDEGPSYWNVAGASYFDCCELIYDLTGGKIDAFSDALVRSMGEYIAKVNICGQYNLNFADAPARLTPDSSLIHRLGRRTGSEMLQSYGAYVRSWSNGKPGFASGQGYRSLKNLCEAPSAQVQAYAAPEKVWLDGLCIMAKREVLYNGEVDPEKGLYLAMKGGHNGESHNHNDVGSVVVYADGKPLLVDAGVGTYTRDTFSANRWKIWTFQSSYHNLPEINGKMQPNGNYRAADVRYEPDDGSLEMELKGAYPADTGIISYRRKSCLADGQVVITDSLHLQQPGTVVFNWMTAEQPNLEEPGILRWENGRVAEYPAEMEAVCEEIPLNDGRLIGAWQRKQLYRIRISPKTAIENGVFTLKIK